VAYSGEGHRGTCPPVNFLSTIFFILLYESYKWKILQFDLWGNKVWESIKIFVLNDYIYV